MVERASLGVGSEQQKRLLFEADPRTVRGRLEIGGTIAEHEHPTADILFLIVDGQLDLVLDDETHSLGTGDMVRFDGERTISGTASEPTTALVVLAEKA